MTYLIDQKSGKNIYVYEVEAYWDKEKKQSRQKRRYLGKKDPVTGEITTPRKSTAPKDIRDYGHLHAAKKLGKNLNIPTCLKQTFPDCWEQILHLAYYQLLEAKPMYMQESWAEGSYIKKNMAISSQKISNLLKELGSDSSARHLFFKKWMKQQGEQSGAWIDITSFSSYAKNIDYCEWGYNRDKEKLPQINLGMMVGDSKRLPLYYQLYPGSIADVSTLSNLSKTVKSLGAKINGMVLDRGYYSASNIKEMLDDGLNIIIPLPSTVKDFARLIEESEARLESPLSSFQYQGQIFFSSENAIEIEGHKLKAIIYKDESRKTQELQNLLRRIHDVEDLLKRKRFSDYNKVIDAVNSAFKGGAKYFEIEYNVKTKKAKLIRNEASIKKTITRMGKMILITNKPNSTASELLQLYRQRDGIEKIFDSIKNELSYDRLRVHSNEAMEGRLFIAFIAVILYTSFLQRLKSSELIKKYSVAKAIMELKKIRAIKFSNNTTILTEITKKQRELFDALDVSIPVKPSY